jgi:succinyl-CoA synthetase beta subunit
MAASSSTTEDDVGAAGAEATVRLARDLIESALGKDILENSGLPIVSANDLGDAAAKIVAEVKKAA